MALIFSNTLYRSSRVILFAFIAAMMIGGIGCKSKKKAGDVTDTAAEKAKMEQEALEREKQRAEEERRRAEEERLRLAREKAREEAEAPANKLSTYFNAVANASSATSANQSINEALTMFASPQTPVLIVISEVNGQKDYDRPTTIKEYLNYLKDQKKNINSIGDLQYDSSGKITELELIKRK
ncbi:nucleoid-structuring protein H-NS [Fulvivirga sp. 29W222]|uniref:Nucleoid-structuring protein H-NS n=1 Tax=Fulvivirga marina TaxID=2494733 RepID=A0A937FYE7_9BACT|nr:nucleoid-structuring protein H-NS [Fulvivirga marina]MBL6447292.1 nucleoid-structuring protein H-NS [Fulvivirga marina]